MAQSDQTVQNSTFPAVRTDINDNLAALYSQSSGPSAPATTVAYQPWVDTSTSPAVLKFRNGTNTGWIVVGNIDTTTFSVGGVTPITSGGTGQITAAAALAALLPSQAGNAGKGLTTNGTVASWGTVAGGASLQVFTSSTTYSPTAGKSTFLVFATGGGGGSGGSDSGPSGATGGGGGGGTAMRLYTSAEIGASATVTIGAAGSNGNSSGSDGGNGGSTVFTPSGTGLAITGAGGSGSPGTLNTSVPGGNGGSTTNSVLAINGQRGGVAGGVISAGGAGGCSFWGRSGANGTAANSAGNTGLAGNVVILEW